MPTILISGTNRGIGRELVRQFSSAGWQVIATVRRPGPDAVPGAPGVRVEQLEASDPASIAALARRLDGVPLDVVLANAGIARNLGAGAGEVSADEMREVFETNLWGPLGLAVALRANLFAGERKVVLAMSSLMSSIAANDWGTQYSYRASKAALNALWSALAREWTAQGITCTLLRPGMVATDMTDHRGIPVEESVAGMVRVVENLCLADSGRIIGYDGRDVPW
ncbi:SDR family oxidoreductase [Celeribacter indicus]|uniref:Short-chain dehydrogenase n=1 Tax=Celeribacter indicus TaxID=1208324 RepID=A0A0B5E2G3_9RHOB|nr:SDR family oxidoreductase [Celeribacter indicus]AJE47580.1 short-chain dehydrogenase [Celeribacter indicus]SDW10879.1 Short-chain dehydrogenase [Celeribacter indicus]